MAVKKISVALEEAVATAAASAADALDQSLSSWLNDAAQSVADRAGTGVSS